MNHDEGYVDELESACEEALQHVVEEHFEGVSPRTVHLMAKAAVSVLEAVVEEIDETDEGDESEEDGGSL